MTLSIPSRVPMATLWARARSTGWCRQLPRIKPSCITTFDVHRPEIAAAIPRWENLTNTTTMAAAIFGADVNYPPPSHNNLADPLRVYVDKSSQIGTTGVTEMLDPKPEY